MFKKYFNLLTIIVLLFLIKFNLSFKLIKDGLNNNNDNSTFKRTDLDDFDSLPPPCNSTIWCYGDILHTVQMAEIFEDSKTFVDMKLKKNAYDTWIDFEEINKTSFEEIKSFVENHFEHRGAEFTNWIPDDWKENPRFLDSIRNPELKQWGQELNKLWKILGRKMIDDVAENPDLYSIIYVKNPLIVPGGRFLEFYYWDSYWIIRGLLQCQMTKTAKGMLENFLSLIERFGFIPNGGRKYYLNRSQPPLLAAMIKSYIDYTGDDKFAVTAVKILEKEFNFFMKNHTILVNGHRLAIWNSNFSGPRPESYREDYSLAQNFKTPREKQNFYVEIKSAAESGMDFSGRFFINENGTNKGNLTNIKTRSIVPVELNAFLFRNARIISEFYMLAGNIDKSIEFERKALEIQKAIEAVLWDKDIGVWLDYDLINKKRRNYFVPTNLTPLWVKCYDITNSEKIAKLVLGYLNKTGVDKYPGGVPNTLENTGEQWDYPNVWPPMQYNLIMGLDNLGTTETKKLAKEWATRWVQSNYMAFMSTGEHHMYEKYNAEEFGGHGGGGEYGVQIGFGWSNGVILDLLVKYGDSLKPAGNGNNNSENGNNSGNLITSKYFVFILGAHLSIKQFLHFTLV